jgi:quercetin dioxygenase-like cupin family protein
MSHLLSASAQSYDLQGVTFNSFISSQTGATQLAAWRADFPPATSGAAHTMTEEEVLHVLAGALDVEIDDERFTAQAGDAILVPAGARFRLSNSTTAPAQAWVTTRLGMTAVMHGSGQHVVPPWAQ